MISGLNFHPRAGGAVSRSGISNPRLWRGGVDGDQIPEKEDRPTRRMLYELQNGSRLARALGTPYFVSCTALCASQGAYLPPALHPATGYPMRWGLWAPHRKLLIDFFDRELPSPEELDARASYAESHALRYVIVEPGYYLPLDDLLALATDSITQEDR